MSILSHKPNLSKFSLHRSIAILAAITFVLAGSCFFIAHAKAENKESKSEMWEQEKAEKMEMAKLKAAKRIASKAKKIVAHLNLSDEEAESLAPKVEAVMQHRMMRAKALGPMLKDLKKILVAGDDAAVASALEAYKTKRSALETEFEALEASLLEGLTPRQEALLTLSGAVGKRGGLAMFKDWRGHGKEKFKDRDGRRGRWHRRHGHGMSKRDCGYDKSKCDLGHDKSKHRDRHDKSDHGRGHGKSKHGYDHGKPKHDHDESKHDRDHDKSEHHH